MRMAKQPKVLQHSSEEACIQAELDIDYIRTIKEESPVADM